MDRSAVGGQTNDAKMKKNDVLRIINNESRELLGIIWSDFEKFSGEKKWKN